MSQRQRTQIISAIGVSILAPAAMIVAMTVNGGQDAGASSEHAQRRIQAELARWRKLDANGAEVAPKVGPWACVADARNNVIWEVKSWQENVHHYKSSFSWRLNDRGEAGRGSCILGDHIQPCDTDDLIAALNRVRYCGVASWRLPTIEELRSLMDRETYPGQPMINAYLFPRTAVGPYWSSTVRDGDGSDFSVMTFNFYQGSEQALPPRTAAWARLVSSMEQ
ncbi:DUF1566 domain-containing protein [Hahella sp. CR1]|uniref:Lcl C-terminal domain-containing protein n=1 Tax=Hahella sp. CR1 TaxID=2992807 RepID=UPI0024422FD7|nr:DUF1566 domain-containing protein [Hahella sp. CR1]MDG9670502.1 DUF1566 domain-containing protein [Hahella sp. CR1]